MVAGPRDLAIAKRTPGDVWAGPWKKIRQSHDLPEPARRCEDGHLWFRAAPRGRYPPARRESDMETIKTVLFLLVAAALAGAGMLVVIGGADGEFTHEGIVRITHPYPSTFEVMSDPKKRMYWVPGITASTKLGAGELDVGSSIREVVSVEGVRTERVYEIKAYTQSRKLSLATSDEFCDYEVTYNFSSHQTGRKTLLKYTIRAQFHHWFDKLIEPVRSSKLKERVRVDVEALKTVLETTNVFR